MNEQPKWHEELGLTLAIVVCAWLGVYPIVSSVVA
jgi:hypothetical protein